MFHSMFNYYLAVVPELRCSLSIPASSYASALFSISFPSYLMLPHSYDSFLCTSVCDIACLVWYLYQFLLFIKVLFVTINLHILMTQFKDFTVCISMNFSANDFLNDQSRNNKKTLTLFNILYFHLSL